MKPFLKTLLAVICGILITGIIVIMIVFSFVGSLASDSSTVLPKEGVLDLKLDKISITEQSGESVDPRTMFAANVTESISLYQAVQAINTAATDPGIKYIYLRPDHSSLTISKIEELRKALELFRKSGKAVVSFIEMPTSETYWLASVSDKIYLPGNKGLTSLMTGVGSQMVFLKDILDKLGINVQLIRHGKYKSAGEMFIKSSPSAENLEQYQEMINSLWKTIASDSEKSRNLEAGSLSRMIDNLELNSPEDFLKNGLVDELVSRQSLQENLSTLALADNWKDVKLIPFASYAKSKVTANIKTSKKIAVVYAAGDIKDGVAGEGVLGDRFSAIIEKLRQDKDVKAVVLRVNSPGGSVSASDRIKNEIDLLRAEKPVIASYGDYAASGGYWISNSCDKIFTCATTLTGSIGVFSIIPDFSKTVRDKAHVNIVTVGSSKRSDMFSLLRPLDAKEIDYFQASVEDIYDSFVSIVSEGRNMSKEDVDNIAQGRVWTGDDALGIGLVDEIGTLNDAIAFAALSAGDPDLANWNVVGFPKARSPFDSILEILGQSEESVLAGTPFESIEKAFKDWDFNSSEKIYARLPYVYIIN